MEKISGIEQQFRTSIEQQISNCAENQYIPSIDYETRLPYPIAPTWGRRQLENNWEDRHHAAYQRMAPELQGDAGRAVRHSRVQLVPRWLHNRYHGFYPDGIELPQTELDKFCFSVLACAGVIPDKAIDVSGKKPQLVNIDPKGYRYFRRPGRLHPEYKINKYTKDDDYAKHRGIFFMKYILENNLEEISPELLERFLLIDKQKHSKRRLQMGWLIVGKAIEVATEPIKPLYKKAQEMGMLDKSCPTDPRQVIKRAVRHHPPNYFDELERRVGQLIEVA